MNRKLLLVLVLIGAWLAYERWDRRPVAHAPGVLVAEAPQQMPVGESVFRYDDYILTRRARFSMTARVLSSRRYWLGREADLAPIDLALGWGVMSDQALIDLISVRQGGRWYFTRWSAPLPIQERLVSLNSGNMHMIPDRPSVARTLRGLRPGDVVRLGGFLVDVDHPTGWHWRTSTSREDTGAGACEIVYVESLSVETENYLTN